MWNLFGNDSKKQSESGQGLGKETRKRFTDLGYKFSKSKQLQSVAEKSQGETMNLATLVGKNN